MLLAQHLQPFPDARGEERVVEEYPGLIEDEQRRPAVEPFLQPMEEVGQNRRDRTGLAHERLGFEALDIGECQILLCGIEQRSAERRVGKECGSTCRARWSPYH